VSRKHKSNKVSKSLVALGSAAVLTVYSAGYFRTRAAAERFADDTKKRLVPTVAAGLSENTLVVPAPVPAPTGLTATAPRPAPVPVPVPARKSEKKAAPKQSASVSMGTPAPAAVAPPVQAEPVAPVQIPTPAPTSVPAPAPVPVPAPEPTTPAPAKPTTSQWKDGTYTGWGTSRHGDIQATVVIENGRIASATISQCLTRYSCSVVTPLLPQIVSRQSPETDYVSGATQSTNALYYAVVEALGKAK